MKGCRVQTLKNNDQFKLVITSGESEMIKLVIDGMPQHLVELMQAADTKRSEESVNAYVIEFFNVWKSQPQHSDWAARTIPV